MAKYYVNNKRVLTGRRRFKCLDCGQRFGEYKQLYTHAAKYHKDLIGDEDVDKYLYEKRNPGIKYCVICKTNRCEWDPKKKKYNRMCGNPECREKARKLFSKNMKKIYGTDNLAKDPERQAAMLANRSIAGTFTWPDGNTVGYVGTYEEDFLKHCVTLNLGYMDVITAPPSTYLKYYDTHVNKERYYLPDFYMPKYDLVVEIKDSSKYPIESKAKARMKENAVVKQDKYNYIKIVEKDYTDFDNLIETLNESSYAESKSENGHFFIIPVSKFDL